MRFAHEVMRIHRKLIQGDAKWIANPCSLIQPNACVTAGYPRELRRHDCISSRTLCIDGGRCELNVAVSVNHMLHSIPELCAPFELLL